MNFPVISEIAFRSNPKRLDYRDQNVVAWASFVVGGIIKVEDALIIRYPEGRLALRWPQVRDRKGFHNSIVYPISKEFAHAAEVAVLEALQSMSSNTGASGLPDKNGPQTLSATGV